MTGHGLLIVFADYLVLAAFVALLVETVMAVADRLRR